MRDMLSTPLGGLALQHYQQRTEGMCCRVQHAAADKWAWQGYHLIMSSNSALIDSEQHNAGPGGQSMECHFPGMT